MRTLYTICIVLLFGNVAKVSASEDPGLMLFETVTSNSSNLNSKIFTLLQDSQGFIWLGTDAGLLRFDGYRSSRVQSPDPDHTKLLSSGTIEAIVHGGDSSLWIGTDHGLINLNLKTWETKRSATLQKNKVRALLVQNDTTLWIGTDHGLYRFNPDTDDIVYYSRINAGLSQNIIRALYMDFDANLWVGTADKLNVLYAGKGSFESFDLKGDYKTDISHNLILDIKPISEKNDSVLFVGTETGLYAFNRHSKDFKIYNKTNCNLSNEVIKTIYIKNPEEIYLGTDMGLNKLDIIHGTIENFYHNPFNQYTIVNNEIWNILVDKKGNLWLGTSNGISKLISTTDFFTYYPVNFEVSGETTGTRVSDIAFDNKGFAWAGTSNGLVHLSVHDKDIGRYMTTICNSTMSISNINTISIDYKNRIWVGSVAGVNIWNPASQTMYLPQMDNGAGFRIASNYISSIIPAYDNYYWIGTWGGGLHKASCEDVLEEIEIKYVADLNGQLCAGKDYLFALGGNSIKKFSIATEKTENIAALNQIAENTSFSSLCVSADNFLWVGAKNRLLKYCIDSDTFEVIPMPTDEEFIISGLIEDNKGFIWGCNTNTIFRFDPGLSSFKFFPIPERIPLKKFIPAPFRRCRGNNLLVCGYNGLLSFNPDSSDLFQVEKPVRFTSIKLNGEAVFPSSQLSRRFILNEVISNSPDLELSYKNRNIEIEFSSLPYDGYERERYAYLLSGYDKSWKLTTSSSNSASYSNLPPGKYKFLVKSAAGNIQSTVTSMNIRINRPFYTHPLLVLVYSLIAVFVLGIIIFQYIHLQKEKQQFQLIQIEKDNNESLSSAKTKFFVNISHELLKSIGLITYPLRTLLANSEIQGSIRKSLLLIEKNTYFLKAYVDQLLNFRTHELGHNILLNEGTLELTSFCKQVVHLYRNKAISKGVILKFKSEIKELKIETDEDKLHSILQNLLSNAITFTPTGGEVVVFLRHEFVNEVIIEVKDNGIGISENEQEKIFERFVQIPNENISNRGMGIGLTIVKDFVKVLNGRIDLNSLPGKGTSIKITLPSQYENIQKLENGILTKEIVNKDAIVESRKPVLRNPNIENGLPSVLVIDENNEFFEHIQLTFINKYLFFWVSSGEEALDFLNNYIPGIIVSEIQLPGMNGISFCKQLRKKANTNRIPIIFLTSNADMENQVKAIQSGVDVFLTKPCDLKILEAHFTNMLRKTAKTEEFISRRLLMNAPPAKTDSNDDKLLKEVVDYIHKNMTDSQLTAKEISYALGISHSNLYRRIKHSTGLSLNEFVRNVRLQNAERLLASGKQSVSEVMFEVGFTNHSYFSKCFKKLYNTTPKKYSLR
jgi:signal transduction histidine kinase/ligand-binding sensor domain-containing protein/DNA-binding response OmpR family regulator